MTEPTQERSLASLLAQSKTKSRSQRWGWVLVGVALVGVAVWAFRPKNEAKHTYITASVTRGPIDVNVTADGTLMPERVVSLGSSLSGIVERVAVDVNDPVKKGQVLIELDRANAQGRVARARATLTGAEARVAEALARENEAELGWTRMENIRRRSGGQLPAQADMDAQAAKLASAKAGVLVAKAAVEDAKAALTMAETDLDKTLIRSPIDGVVLARSVEPGYAVAASLQAVELLELGSDLSELELTVHVDEADIGVVKPGQATYFTVSAFPNETFPAELVKVAYGSTRTANVVTYTAYLRVKNPNLKLRPGMTASTTIATGHADDVMLVPNSAFRFEIKDEAANKPKVTAGPPHRQVVEKHRTETAVHGERHRTLYVMRDGEPHQIEVITGLNDGVQTAIRTDELKVGDQVIVDRKKAKK